MGKLKRKLPGLGHNGEIEEMLVEQKDDVCNGHEKKNHNTKRLMDVVFRAPTTHYDESTIHLTCSDSSKKC